MVTQNAVRSHLVTARCHRHVERVQVRFVDGTIDMVTVDPIDRSYGHEVLSDDRQ